MKKSETTTADTFEILQRDVLILPRDDHSARQAISGDVARVPGHKDRIGRWVARGCLGAAQYGYVAIPHDHRQAPEVLATPRADHDDLLAQLRDGATNPRLRLGPIEPTVEEQELARFRAAWPHVAYRLGLVEPEVEGLFNPGRTYKPFAHREEIGVIDWRAYLVRHQTGDFGDLGRHSPERLDPVTAWTIGLQSDELKNAFAVMTGAGLVRSRYEASERPHVVVHATTALMGSNSYTVLMAGARQV